MYVTMFCKCYLIAPDNLQGSEFFHAAPRQTQVHQLKDYCPPAWSARGRVFAAPRYSLLSLAHICYATNVSGNQVFQGAQNVVIRGCTSMAADTVSSLALPHTDISDITETLLR